MGQPDVLLIGVDGGATEVKAHAVICDDLRRPLSFELRPTNASRRYRSLPGFAPLPVSEQLAQRDAAAVRVTPDEREQGALWVEAACDAILEVAQACGVRRLLIGAGMPGLKTTDGHGICVMNNGPRILDYLDRLERGLKAAGVELLSPVATLGSDADYCGLGEEYAADGLFRDVANAYYVGGGTGLADAMKLGGQLLPFDRAKTWILKSWQMPSALGPTFEKLISAKSLNERYADLVAAKGGADDKPAFPEGDAADGRPVAVAWMNGAALVLAELIFERLDTIKNGRKEAPHRGQAYLELNASHQHRGTYLDRVIVGQRVGQIYADARFDTVLAEKVDTLLAAFIVDSGDTEMVARYLDGGRLKPGFVRASKLRAAPALGAAIAAVQALQDSGT